ncbi:C40 family peptidase [Rhodobium gokarnense]|uniref:Cell wall-associated NlpC family hydrolase n=1 Tax=Rhodobium gokarnense TaxID=364296 RepID=A0ABT3H7Z5_9HYPH|nr:NlpC/P60 family protein [Rhodobium gokarnense]MCW2306525.1 cell wall-associated NlpC family hydrolase [Rhodobium gokarnense]
MTEFDRRRHPVRPDLAAEAYRGRVEAGIFAEGIERRILADAVPLRPEADERTSIDSEALFGETFTVFEEGDAWCWGQLATDGYVGWLPAGALGMPGPEPTHRVAALRSYRYPEPELKLPPLGLLSMGARVTVVGEERVRDLDYAVLADGTAMVARHLMPLGEAEPDWVAVAERLAGTPYLWGGRTSLGLDCSALIQLACQAAGIDAPRDSDMQEDELGSRMNNEKACAMPCRGDLYFWKGHVGVLSDPQTLLHANGFTMTVDYEPLAAVTRRLEEAGLPVTAIRRIA